MNESQQQNKKFSLSDLEIELLAIERDTAQYRKERIDNLLLREIGKTQVLKEAENKTETKQPAAVNEGNFSTLKFEPQEGAKLGDYEVAYKPNNLPEKYQAAYNILSLNNASISSRYHGEGYVFSYWIYGEGKIYRQKLKPKENQ